MLSMYRVRAGGISCRGLKENVAALPSPVGVKRITFPSLAHTIEPMPGKMASVAIYSHLSDKHGGRITKQAAREALDLYAEVSALLKGVVPAFLVPKGTKSSSSMLFRDIDPCVRADG